MTNLTIKKFSDVANQQNDFFTALQNLNKSVLKANLDLKKKYPSMNGLSSLYFSCGHFGNPDVSGISGELDEAFNLWIVLNKKDAIEYLKEISVDETFEKMKNGNKLIFDAFFSGNKYLLAIRPYGNEMKMSSAPYINSGAYLIHLT